MPAEEPRSGQQVVNFIDGLVKREFDSNQRVLTFQEYLMLVAAHPERHTRGSAQYLIDMMDFFGKEPCIENESQDGMIYRFKIFDRPVDGIAPKVVGHEQVHTHIYRTLKSFVGQKHNNKLILLHGPNGSAKTTIAHALMGGIEVYCRQDDGAQYTFNWVFPNQQVLKGGMGINTYTHKESVSSYARLQDEEIAAKIPCDLKDHPLLLIPRENRLSALQEILGAEKGEEIWQQMPNYLAEGDLSHRSKEIFEALLESNNGDYRKVLAHVQVDRLYLSRRYRQGLTTVEPQMHVDAQYDQLTINRNLSSLPASLQGISLFTVRGDLVAGNRGVIEYSDLLKRPVDTFKYLLVACETGAVNIGPSIAYLDAVMIGSTNELQLDAFKEFPDFSSFKARIELIRVPYLLSVTQEQEIYQLLIPQMAQHKHVAPNVARTLALWTVLTRLKKPNSINYPPNVSALVSNLSPIEKARLYDVGEMPVSLNPEERKLLAANLPKLRDEYSNIPYYEGRMGASVREAKSILLDAIQNPEFKCLSPLAILSEMQKFVKHVSDYEFLKQDVKDGFHDATEFIKIVRNEFLNTIDREVRDSMGIYDAHQWEDFIKRYVHHVSHLLKKEKVHNPVTGKYEPADEYLIKEFEGIVGAPKEAKSLQDFRQNVISQVGAWSLDHPGQEVQYQEVFPQYWRKLEGHYYESQKALLTKMYNALLVYEKKKDDKTSEGDQLARQTIENMTKNLGYCRTCAKETITFLMRMRY